MAQPVKVSLPAAKVSKNQRVGEKQKQKVKVCPKGHPVTVALFVPVKGKTRIIYICNCNSAGPENDGRVKATGEGWVQRKDTGVPGKKRDAVKSKGSTNVYLGG